MLTRWSHYVRPDGPTRRLHRGAHPRAFIAVLVASALGIAITLLGLGRLRTTEREFSVVQNTREVQSQVQLLAESVRASLEKHRAEAISFYQLRMKQETVPLLPEGPILHWAELSVAANGQVGLRGIAQGPTNDAEALNAGYTDALIAEVRQSRLVAALQSTSYQLIDLPWLLERQPRTRVMLMQPQPQKTGTLVAIALRMDLALPIFGHFSSYSEAGNLRAYLVDPAGTILGHSQSGYLGTHMDQLPLFKNALSAASRGERISGAGEFLANDQLPVLLAYRRLPDTPYVLTVERLKSSLSRTSLIQDLPLLDLAKLAGQGLGLGLLLLLANLGLARWSAPASVVTLKDEEEEEEGEKIEGPSPDFTASEPGISARVNETVWVDPIQSLDPTPGAPLLFNAPTDFYYIRQNEGVQDDDPEWVKQPGAAPTVEPTLVQKASKLYGCPAYFFKYLPRTGIAILESYETQETTASEAMTDLAFPLSKEDLAELLDPNRSSPLEGWVGLHEPPALKRLLGARGALQSWAYSSEGAIKGVLVLVRSEGAELAESQDFMNASPAAPTPSA